MKDIRMGFWECHQSIPRRKLPLGMIFWDWLPYKFFNRHTYVTDVTDAADVIENDPKEPSRPLS